MDEKKKEIERKRKEKKWWEIEMWRKKERGKNKIKEWVNVNNK